MNSESRIITIDVPANRKEELKRLQDLHYEAWKESLRAYAEAQAAEHESRRCLEALNQAIDKISEPRDWNNAWAYFEGDDLKVCTLEEKPETAPSEYTDPINPSFIGYDRETNKPLAKYFWNKKTGWFTLQTIHQERWERPQAESLVAFLHLVNNNRPPAADDTVADDTNTA